jgi:ectoine hydroxylase-related dioxygenase (phytanoyl-CoA dioxygenase family)
MSAMIELNLQLSEEEMAEYNERGYVLRRNVLGPDDLKTLSRAGEELVTDLESQASAAKQERGSYIYQNDTNRAVIVKWEDDREHVQGIEPFAHLHPVFNTYGRDERLLAPMRSILGVDQVVMYTEKLNLKRARIGGPIVLHQDYPYWVPISDKADQIANAMVFLDDSNESNGCLQVAPGSHRAGKESTRVDDGKPNEMDMSQFDTSTMVSVEAKAGDVLFFGPLLVHRSDGNTSDSDRRVLLYSFQPAGHRHILHFLRERWAEEAAAADA